MTEKQTISLIAALGKDRIIGSENKLIWDIPGDMKHFRNLTSGKTVVMGRKTYESIGRPLPKRKNIIITRDRSYRAEGCIVVHSLDDALKHAGPGELMVIGGAQIYSEFLPKAHRMYLTLIDHEFEGDAKFPKWKDSEWKIVSREDYKEGYSYSFVNFERITG
jgi:dihydrofolate reductase